MTDRAIVAIPTVFNGIEYRSRMEADTAKMLTELRIPFDYEARSYLLTNGYHYRPDFLLYGGRQILEVRGYSSDKGNAQIEGFCREVANGRHGNLTFAALMDDLVLIPLVAGYHAVSELQVQRAFTDRDWCFKECWRCKGWHLAGPVPLPCSACGCWMNGRLREVQPLVSEGGLHYLGGHDGVKLIRAVSILATDCAVLEPA